MKSMDDIVWIINSGGGVIVDSSMTTDALVKLARLAADKKCTVIVKNAGEKTTDHLIRIASHGKGSVILDLTD